MYAIIRACHRGEGLAVTDVAGRPLIARQLEWLHACGIEHVAIEIASGQSGERVMAHLQEKDPIGRQAAFVLTRGPTPPQLVAKRAGFPRNASIVVLDHNVLGDADLVRLTAKVEAGGALLRIPAPSALRGVPAGVVRIVRPGAHSRIGREAGCWAVSLRDELDARALAFAVLATTLPDTNGGWPLQVHATPSAPGVWIGRGAVIDPTATIEAPVLVGPGARVGARARLGPGAVVGPSAVIDRDAIVRDALVGEGVIVGEGVTLESCDVREDGTLIDRRESEPKPITVDPLLIGARSRSSPKKSWLPRALAGAALAGFIATVIAASPVLLACLILGSRAPYDRLRTIAGALIEAAMGTRSIVGVCDLPSSEVRVPPGLRELAQGAPRGLFDVEQALVGAHSSTLARLGARAWYARHKSVGVDLRLLARAAWVRSGARTPVTPAQLPAVSDDGAGRSPSWSSARRR